MLGEVAWKKMHLIYSSLAKTATGSVGKLQAAFDLEYSSLALLNQERLLLPFTNGGVDVYACSSLLKQRAKAHALASQRLFIKPMEVGVKDVVVVAKPQHLLTLLEPVPRFALLPVPQRIRTAVSPPQKQQPVAPQPLKSSATTTGTATERFGRVLGSWLS
jgi:hypothetical protein